VASEIESGEFNQGLRGTPSVATLNPSTRSGTGFEDSSCVVKPSRVNLIQGLGCTQRLLR
jgi:hypothetical protein